jgi:methyltransferase family protein
MNVIPYPAEASAIEVPLPMPYTIESEARVILWLAGFTTGSILEVGCAQGYLTKALALRYPKRTIYALDWAANPGLSVHQDSERPDVVASRALHLPNVIAINGDSKRFDYPAGVGFAFIDGDHSPDGVKSDTDKALASSASMIVWHDYRPESMWMGVAPLLNGLADSGMPLVLVEGTPIVVKGWPCA